MSRLPHPGADTGQWGDILNDYLSQSHNTDGTLKDNTVGSSQLQDNAVTNNILAHASVTAASIATNAVTASALAPNAVDGTHIADGTITTTQLDAPTNALLAKADSAVQPGTLSTVAVSGAYGDLTGKPTLGSAASHSATDFDAAGAAAAAVSAHAGGTGVHSIAGVTGLEDMLASLSGTIIPSDRPAKPATGTSATYWVTSAVAWPSGLVWSSDPDGGIAPTVTGTALVTLFTVSGITYAVLCSTFPVVDVTAPTWSATLTTGTPTLTAVVVAASALASDNIAVTAYECSIDGGGTWASVTPSGTNFTLTGLSPATAYPAPKLRAKDAAGNTSSVLTAQPFTTATPDATAPTAGTLSVTAHTSTTINVSVTGASDETALAASPYAFSSDNGSTWSAYQAGATYGFSGLSPATSYTVRHRVKDAAGNVSTGTGVTQSTDASPDATAPTVGSMAASSITSYGFTLTVTGASDETALAASPYAFTTDGGSTWTAYQSSATYAASGLSASTGYSCNWRVKDAAGNVSTGTAQTVTTSVAPASLSQSYVGEASGTITNGVADFTNAAIGAGAADRTVVAMLQLSAVGSRSITSATIGGVSATVVNILTGNQAVALIYAAVPSGTTATIHVVSSGASLQIATAHIYRVTGGTVGTGTSGTNAANPTASVTLAAVDGGLVFGHATSAANAHTWTGATETYDTTGTGAAGTAGGSAVTCQAALSVTVTLAAATVCRTGGA